MMNTTKHYLDWREHVVYAAGGPQPTICYNDDKVKTLLVGLEPGQRIPEHPESAAVYHFLDGDGCMTVDGQPYEVRPGTTIIMGDGAARGLEAYSRLAFLAVRIA